MKKVTKLVLFVVLGLMVLLGANLLMAASASTSTTCKEVKFDTGAVGTHTKDGITIVISSNGTYTYVSSVSAVPGKELVSILVKGGPGSRTYTLSGSNATGTFVAPVNSSGHPADVSHVIV